MGAKYQVVGNFSPGQFSFKTKREALAWAKRKRKAGYKARVLKFKPTISKAERRRFEIHRRKVVTMARRMSKK